MEYPLWQHQERQMNLYPDGLDALTGDADVPHAPPAPHNDDGISHGGESATRTGRSTSMMRRPMSTRCAEMMLDASIDERMSP